MDKMDELYYALMKSVSKNGIGRIKTKELAKEIGIAEGTIFFHYGTIRNLLDETAMRFDRELMERCITLINKGYNLRQMWDDLFEHLLKNPDGANFYFAYVYYYGFDPTESNKRAYEFLTIAEELFKEKKNLTNHQILIFWDYFTTQLFYYINKISTGLMENSDDNKAFIKHIVFTTYDNI